MNNNYLLLILGALLLGNAIAKHTEPSYSDDDHHHLDHKDHRHHHHHHKHEHKHEPSEDCERKEHKNPYFAANHYDPKEDCCHHNCTMTHTNNFTTPVCHITTPTVVPVNGTNVNVSSGSGASGSGNGSSGSGSSGSGSSGSGSSGSGGAAIAIPPRISPVETGTISTTEASSKTTDSTETSSSTETSTLTNQAYSTNPADKSTISIVGLCILAAIYLLV